MPNNDRIAWALIAIAIAQLLWHLWPIAEFAYQCQLKPNCIATKLKNGG